MPPLFPKSVHDQTISEAKKAHSLMEVNESIFLNKPAVSIGDEDTATINNEILSVIKKTNPDIVLIPYFDRHIDHRVIFDACMVLQTSWCDEKLKSRSHETCQKLIGMSSFGA